MEQYNLSNNYINHTSEQAEKFFLSAGVERREAIRVKLALEEVLLEYQAEFGEDKVFRIRRAKRFSAARIEIIVEGRSFDPFNKESDEDDVIRRLLAGVGLAPLWNYKNGKNYIIFTPKRKPLSDSVKMGAAILLAILVGIILTILPDSINENINSYLLTPLTNAFMGLITAVAGPLVFFSVLGSICSMGNMETLGKIGSKTIKIITIYITVIGILMTGIGCLFFPIEWDGGTSSNFSQVADMVYDIIPSNLFEPFLTGNALQLIFIAVIVGLAVLMLSSKVNGVVSLIEQLNSIIQTIMAGLSSVLPILIFVLFTGMISSGKMRAIIDSWKMIAIFCALIVAFYILNILRIAIFKKVSPILLFKKAFPAWLIAFTTSSSAAAMTTSINDAHRRLGIDKKLADFGIPIGQVLFMPGIIALFFPMEASFAVIYDIPITFSWIIIGFITNILISFALPPIPGGAMMGFTVVFAQLGIPMEVIGVALAANAITDFFGTAINISSWQLTLIDVADSLNMLDKETLRSDKT